MTHDMDGSSRSDAVRIAALWAAIVGLAVVAGLTYWTTSAVVSTLGSVEHTHAVLESLNVVTGALAEAESLKRAYAVTGDETMFDKRATAIARLQDARADLRGLATDNPDQLRRLDDLETLLGSRLGHLDDAMRRRKADGFDLEREAESAREGERLSDEVREAIALMVEGERRLLKGRERRARQTILFTRIAQFAGTGGSLAFLVVAFRGLRREVALRRGSERAIRDSEEGLATTLQSIGDGVIATDALGRVSRMNPVAEALTGWPASEAIGKPFKDVCRLQVEETGGPAVDPVDAVLREGTATRLMGNTILVARNGEERRITDCAAPIRDAAQRLVGVVLVFRDTTAERQAENRLRDANLFVDSIVENIPNMIFVKDARELRFRRFNRAGELLLGASREQLLGKSDTDLFPPDQAAFFQAKDREVLEGGQVVDIAEEPIETPAGRRWLHTKKIPILDGKGAPGYLLGISEDITELRAASTELRRAHDELEERVAERTNELSRAYADLTREVGERKQAEEALARSQEQFRQAQKMEAIGRLAGGIAHDFNNLLSVILSYSEMIGADLAPSDPVKADLAEIERAGQRAADLTRQLLAFSRQQVLAPRVVDLDQLIGGMEKMLRRVIGEDVELRTLRHQELGKVRVDPGQMEQVVMNLVVNARDAMPTGGHLTIETGNVEIDEEGAANHAGMKPGPHVMLAVTDTGTGMDKETQSRIFEPFFTTKEAGKGTGLGLATVFGIVRQSGGHVWVYSEPGQGTTFKIYLPRTPDDVVTPPPPASTATLPRGSETILLVEDEEQVRHVARSILERSGYVVLEAQNAGEALLLCERFSGTISLMVTDVVMPSMSGRELAERMTILRPGMKVLFMSGYTDDTVVHHGVLAAGIAFLQKPVTPETLARKVRSVLDPAGG